jgi:hypothetical protein
LDTVDSYEKAKEYADDWLGDYPTWIGEYRAISMYGSVLQICKKD